MNKKLYAVCAISNPARYHSRYRLYREFAKRVEAAGAILITVEHALGHRDFQITQSGRWDHVQVRSFHELWLKENLINLGIKRLTEHDPDWEFVAWLDGDIEFLRPDWVDETVQQLQHYMIVQMFSHALDMGPAKEPIAIHNGFIWSHIHHKKHSRGYSQWHPGYCWGIRREAWDWMGKLLDMGILGSGDRHMAGALIGQVAVTYNARVTQNYKNICLAWQEAAQGFIKGDVGYVPGSIMHHWHGRKADRKYGERWEILVRTKFDPLIDVRYDRNGVLEFTDHNIPLQHETRRYFHTRNEDSIDP